MAADSVARCIVQASGSRLDYKECDFSARWYQRERLARYDILRENTSRFRAVDVILSSIEHVVSRKGDIGGAITAYAESLGLTLQAKKALSVEDLIGKYEAMVRENKRKS